MFFIAKRASRRQKLFRTPSRLQRRYTTFLLSVHRCSEAEPWRDSHPQVAPLAVEVVQLQTHRDAHVTPEQLIAVSAPAQPPASPDCAIYAHVAPHDLAPLAPRCAVSVELVCITQATIIGPYFTIVSLWVNTLTTSFFFKPIKRRPGIIQTPIHVIYTILLCAMCNE